MSPASKETRGPITSSALPASVRTRRAPLAWLIAGAVALGSAGVLALWHTAHHAAPTPRTLVTQAYAHHIAGLVTAVATRNGLHLTVRVGLVPSESVAHTTPAAVADYRLSVTGAALAIGLTDQPTVDAWRAAGRSGQASLMQAWAGLLRGLLPRATIELAVVGGAGVVARGTLEAGSGTIDVHLPTPAP